MESSFSRIKGCLYHLVQKLGIFRLPLWLLNLFLTKSCLEFLLRVSGFNLKLPVPARVAAMDSELKKFRERKSSISCLIFGGWALEGYPKLISTYLPENSTLICIDSYEELSNAAYKYSSLEKISQRYCDFAFQLALKNKRLIESRSKLDVRLICAKKMPHLIEMYDFIFIDTSNEYGVYKSILEDSYFSLRDGGILVGDDFELTLPIPDMLLDECRKSMDEDLIFSKVVMEYVHPGIVLGLHNFICTHPNAKVEAINGVYIIYKNT